MTSHKSRGHNFWNPNAEIPPALSGQSLNSPKNGGFRQGGSRCLVQKNTFPAGETQGDTQLLVYLDVFLVGWRELIDCKR